MSTLSFLNYAVLFFYHLLFSFLPFPAPILCPASCFPLQFLPRLSISHVFSWGSSGTLTVQDCRRLVCARGDPHGCSSQADFVLNLSPRCTQRTIVRLKCVKSITGRERERQTFRVSAGFTRPNLNSFLMLPASELKINLSFKIWNKIYQSIKCKHWINPVDMHKDCVNSLSSCESIFNTRKYKRHYCHPY